MLLAMGCSKPLPTLENIDSKIWKGDRGACAGKRMVMLDAINNQKNKLLSLREMQIVELLGRPDGNELYERNQKFYYYNISPSKTCVQTDSLSIQLQIRFSAMGVAQEVVIKQ
jgi:hypothetical protein